MKRVHFWGAVFIAALTLGGGLAAQTRGVTADDYLSFEFLSDPRFSPDGSTIAYVVTTIRSRTGVTATSGQWRPTDRVVRRR
jgi:Tol biopolymer transport system component